MSQSEGTGYTTKLWPILLDHFRVSDDKYPNLLTPPAMFWVSNICRAVSNLEYNALVTLIPSDEKNFLYH